MLSKTKIVVDALMVPENSLTDKFIRNQFCKYELIKYSDETGIGTHADVMYVSWILPEIDKQSPLMSVKNYCDINRT